MYSYTVSPPISDTQYHPLTLIAIPTEQSYQIVINYGLNRAEAYSLFCDAILECVRLQKGIFSGA